MTSQGSPESATPASIDEFDRMLDDLDRFSIYGDGSAYDAVIAPFGEIKPSRDDGPIQDNTGADRYNMPHGDYTFIDRVRILRGELTHGFTPMTKREASTAMQVMGNDGEIDATDHIEEVLFHQNDIGYDGPRTARAAVHQFVDFHRDASELREALLANYRILQTINNPHLSVELLQDEEKLIGSGVLAVTRREEIDRLVASGDSERVLRDIHKHGISASGGLDPSILVIELENSGIGLSVGSLREATLNSGKEQKNRKNFWEKVLDNTVLRVEVAKPLIARYLDGVV